ncbi:glycosyl hydrolase [Vibrio porteresiae]|uniref:Glycosyl hydrolase n=1 Tax=Vibrio porteresiae DSM 19223 TaxID=1123496 RepID=A0ABZ0QJE3_9VIBR|nr:glycosyl hydrolase [Vibrio porteresiae]WPC76632.1 glycosyl hydrolase [Vibrio porteresiae DSM 19223]
MSSCTTLGFKKLSTLAAAISLSIVMAPISYAATQTTTALENGFTSPPNSAKPRVWWHWMDGNITIDGIDKDLAWMHQVGIGGVHSFDANLPTPQVVKERLVYMTPKWQEAFRHAVKLADQYDMEFGIASSPGWSETGGPWVAAKDGMKKVVWSEQIVTGGEPIEQPLKDFPHATGPFQTVGFNHLFNDDEGGTKVPYADGKIGVYAVPLPHPVLTPFAHVLINGEAKDAAALTDDDFQTSVAVPIKDNKAVFAVHYDQPTTVRSARILIKDGQMPFAPARFDVVLEAQVNGEWQNVSDIPLSTTTTTVGFSALTAQDFRVIVTPRPAASSADILGAVKGAEVLDLFPTATGDIDVLDFHLYAQPKVNQSEVKAGFNTVKDYYKFNNQFDESTAALNDVVDLTDKIGADGKINWVPPQGHDWKIINMGWTLTGKTNHPATKEATGLEVDKYDAKAVEAYLNTYLDKYKALVGDDMFGKKGVTSLVNDSVEIGASNWTPNLLAEFQQRRGYDAKPWLPTLTGTVLGTPQQTDKFLFDFRTTLADLISEAHYGTVAKVAHANGLTTYGEFLEDQRPVLGDDIAARRYTDIPMAALWYYPKDSQARPGLLGDVRGAASTSHFYGQNLVAAESMTSAFAPWALAPEDLKHVIDLEFLYGVNRPVVHTSVHQPVDDKNPGLSLFIFGQHFNRHDSWAGMASAWVDYMARSAYMLQSGKDRSEIALFYGEDTPVTTMYADGVPEGLPKHYTYDFVNKDMLAALTVTADKHIVSPAGAEYQALGLFGNTRELTVSALEQLLRLAKQEVKIIGDKPEKSPSLEDNSALFHAYVNMIWGMDNVVESNDFDNTLVAMNVPHDVDALDHVLENDHLMFRHRQLDNGHIYYVSNRTENTMNQSLTFNVTGFAPQIWNPVDGSHRDASFHVENGQTVVDVDFAPEESLFVVFTEPTTEQQHTATVAQVKQTIDITSPWAVHFEKGLELPKPMTMKTLMPLNESKNKAVRYFSGTVKYQTQIDRPANLVDQDQVWLDLGTVGNVARVEVNGQDAGTVWYAPKRVDISQYLTEAHNDLTVTVSNTWTNRLIGDKQPGAKVLAWTSAPTFKADAKLTPSGLIGPISLVVKH